MRWGLAIDAAGIGTFDQELSTGRLTSRLVVPAPADFCVVTLVEPDGRPRDVGSWHADPAARALLDRYAAVARFEQTPDEIERGITRMRWANAGHLLPMVINPDGSVAEFASWKGDLLLGVDAEAQRREAVVTLVTAPRCCCTRTASSSGATPISTLGWYGCGTP